MKRRKLCDCQNSEQVLYLYVFVAHEFFLEFDLAHVRCLASSPSVMSGAHASTFGVRAPCLSFLGDDLGLSAFGVRAPCCTSFFCYLSVWVYGFDPTAHFGRY